MIEEALRYQTKGDDWVKRVAIGGGLLLFSIFVIPIFTVYGYLLEVIRAGLRGEMETPPDWGDYDLVELTINGLKAFVILFAYSFVVAILAWVPSTLLAVIGGALRLGFIAALGTLVWFVVYLVGSLAVAVITPVALSNFVIEEEISAGFDIDVLKNVVPEMAMLRAVGLGIVVYLIAAFASGLISIFVITALLVPFILFVGFSGTALIWGDGFAEAYGAVYGEAPAVPDGPVDTATAGGGAAAGASTANAPDGHDESSAADDVSDAADDSGADDVSDAADDSGADDGAAGVDEADSGDDDERRE